MLRSFLLCLSVVVAAQQKALTQSSPSAELATIMAQDSAFQQTEFYEPLFPSMEPGDFVRRQAFYLNLLQRLAKIPVDVLSEQERINYEMLQFVLEDRAAQIENKAFLVPLDAEGGWYTDFILQSERVQKSPESLKRYLQRLNAFYDYALQQIALMKKGLEAGRTAPRAILSGRENVVDQCLVLPQESPFYKPFLELPASIPAPLQDSLRGAAKTIIATRVTPAYEAFAKFWKQQYLPGAVESIAITDQPGGRKYYEQRIHYFTTLNLTPEEVFLTGQKEVARIRKQMEAIITELGFEGSFREFLDFLRNDPRFYCTFPEQLLKEASFIAKKIDGKLPAYFGKLPRNSYGVSPVPALLAPTYTGGRYSPGSLANGKAGQFWVNTYNLPARPLYVLPSLTLHEAVPGHHLQISLAQEMEAVPQFRKSTYLSAFGEGWALYAEWLGEEMGIYTTPYERFGQLTYEMWRACRLVVDPAIHAMGWSRQQAIDFMVNNTALSLHECTTEIDRYIGWPGQAVSYKTGELKIRELRTQAEQALGDNFDIRDFHDTVLKNGSIPLFTLERIVQQWIADQNEH